ncbi:MAG: retron St85 family effector protein [Rhodospirillales bacterium]
MDHPLRSKDYKLLRGRVVQILREGFHIRRQSNIVFVCGGNNPEKHLRKKFQLEFSKHLPNHEFFEPEFAMNSYFGLGDEVPFNISEFEELVGQLSHSIVIFPEAPGSFAETGYFSARPSLAKKIILVIDFKRQKSDSFISLGPAKQIQDMSKFQPNIQFDYESHDFSIISKRINERSPLSKTKKSFEVKTFKLIEPFELFCLIHQLVKILQIATTEDIEFFLMSLFKGIVNKSKIKQMISILVGAKKLVEIGDFGHLAIHENESGLLSLKDGAKTEHDVLSLDISASFISADSEFRDVLNRKIQ